MMYVNREGEISDQYSNLDTSPELEYYSYLIRKCLPMVGGLRCFAFPRGGMEHKYLPSFDLKLKDEGSGEIWVCLDVRKLG